MRYRPFGRTGLQVSELVFGGGWVGGILIHQDDATRRAAIASRARGRHQLDRHRTLLRRRPLRAGARLAAPGRGEEAVSSRPRCASTSAASTTSRGQVARSLEQSLERLRCDSVELFQLHNPIGPQTAGRARSGSTRCWARAASPTRSTACASRA